MATGSGGGRGRRGVASRPLTDYRRSALIKRCIDIFDYPVECGLDTVIVSLQIGSWKQCRWPKGRPEVLPPTPSGLKISYGHSHLRVEFSAGKYAADGEEGLLPLVDCPKVYGRMVREVEIKLGCVGIYGKYEAIISRFDLAFDIYYPNTAALVNSLRELPVRGWDRKHPTDKHAYMKTVSSGHRRERTWYDRSDKTGGVAVLRFETRYQKLAVVNRALRLLKGERTRPMYLCNYEIMAPFIGRLFKNNGIFPNVIIKSLDRAVADASHKRTASSLLGYRAKRKLDKDHMQPDCYRLKHGFMVGNSESASSAVVHLYEGLKRAFEKSFGCEPDVG